MTEDWDDMASHMCCLPMEVLLNIFIYLPAKSLTKCREVCVRWKLIIDGMSNSDDLWYKFCNQDFTKIFEVARKKASPDLPWYHLYRSLTLWQRVGESREEIDEFASASCLNEEIHNCEVIGNGVISIHNKSSIVFYDVDTLQRSKRRMINGDYSRYTENENVIIILGYHLHLFVIRKQVVNPIEEEVNRTFEGVKLFTLADDKLYFVNINDEIYVCEYTTCNKIKSFFIERLQNGVLSLGIYDQKVYLLTCKREVYTIVDNKLHLVTAFGAETNLLHELWKYNFLEQLDWRIYFQWMYVLNHVIPDGPLRDIIIIRPYGDVFFVGSNWGVLRIYHAPYSATGELDIFNHQPAKQYNFMDRTDCPVLSTCPILQVDILEVEDGHTIFVAMPKKIAVIMLTHSFKRTASLAMLPYSEIQKVKFLKTCSDN